MSERIQKHHFLYDRKGWCTREDGAYLRAVRSLIGPMFETPHRELHKATPAVPVPSYHMLYRVRRDFIPDEDYLQSIDNLQFAIQEAGRNPKAHPVEREVGELTSHVLDLQKPFIAEGLAVPSKKLVFV